LARATIYGDFVDDAAGNRFYQYDMDRQKSRLVKEGYSLSEINKLKQLRGLHTIETDEKKKKEPAKLESKKRPKTRHYGGTLNESSAAGLVRMFQEGAKFGERL
jgi:hypothetical protein